MAENILVVDDEETVRGIVTSMLLSANYQCRQAGSGLEALALLNSSEKFDLILSGLTMPYDEGLLERTQAEYPDIPVILMTGMSDMSAVLTAIRNGAHDYLLKPFERDQLLGTVRRVLDNRELKMQSGAYQTNLESLVATRTEQLRKSLTNLERSYDSALEALGEALALKDQETAAHCKRVTAFAIAIARAIGLPADQIRILARGAYLHDIGKISIPDSIFRNPGSLRPDEWVMMRQYCYHGYEICKKVPFLTEVADLVYSHQERFDGTGYPRGLKGDELPVAARIIAVANTLDAITSDRPYRPAQSVEAAKEEITRWSGRQFDPKIVGVFLSMPDNIWEDLRKEI